MKSKTKSGRTGLAPSVRSIGIGVAVIGVLVMLSYALPVTQWLADFNAYVIGLGCWGPPLYAIVLAASVALFLPLSPFSLGAGALFDLWTANAVVIIGATCGATVSFLLGRTLLREQVEKQTMHRPSFSALDRAITKSGGRIVFLSRLAPLFPFTIINLTYGVTGIRPLAFVSATALGLIPTTALFTYLGSATTTFLTAESDMTRVSFQVAGILASGALVWWLVRFARRAIREAGIPD